MKESTLQSLKTLLLAQSDLLQQLVEEENAQNGIRQQVVEEDTKGKERFQSLKLESIVPRAMYVVPQRVVYHARRPSN